MGYFNDPIQGELRMAKIAKSRSDTRSNKNNENGDSHFGTGDELHQTAGGKHPL